MGDLALEIQKQFPKEWNRLRKKVQRGKMPPLPNHEREALKEQWSKVNGFREIEFGPVKGVPFVAKCLLLWEGPDPRDITLTEVMSVRPADGASPREKELIKLLVCNTCACDLVFDHIHKASGFKAFQREVKAVDRKTTQLARKYYFDPDEIIDESSR